jgi:hypothetical protein
MTKPYLYEQKEIDGPLVIRHSENKTVLAECFNKHDAEDLIHALNQSSQLGNIEVQEVMERVVERLLTVKAWKEISALSLAVESNESVDTGDIEFFFNTISDVIYGALTNMGRE